MTQHNLAPLRPRQRLEAVQRALLDMPKAGIHVVGEGTATYKDMRTDAQVTMTGEILGVSQAVTGGDALVMRGPAGTLVHVPLSLLLALEVAP